jgi:uncharacterized protein
MTAQFNVSQLLKADVGQIRTYDFEIEDPLDLDGAVATQIQGTVKFTLTNFGILAAVKAHGEVDLTCARCLEPFRAPMDVDFIEEYRPSIDITTGLPANLPASDTAFQISDNHTIDLAEAIRQQFLLGIEIIPVCSPTCKGLCVNCGANLNTDPCNCPPAESNSPFAALQTLLAHSDDR